MINTIDMQGLRYLNLFEKITKINTRFCFKYNEAVVFCVPKNKMQKSLGRDARNIKQISQIIKKRIRIIPFPRGVEDAKEFIKNIVFPVQFKEVKITPTEIILTAGKENKAALIGRNKRRLLEMQHIIKNFFERDFRII